MNEAIKVIVRANPESTPGESAWKLDEEINSICTVDKSKSYSFDRVNGANNIFNSTSSHQRIYEEGITDTASECLLRGNDVAILAYGFPGSGKSYSLFGTHGQSRMKPEARGIVARVGNRLLELVQDKTASDHLFKITASFYHIFEDGRVADLLDSRKRSMRITRNTSSVARNAYLPEGITEAVVSSPNDLVQVIEKGNLMRNATGIRRNPVSGKVGVVPGGAKGGPTHVSHAVFVLRVEHLESQDSEHAFVGQFTAVDISGSSVEAFHTAEEDLEESSNIANLHSLLGRLSEGKDASNLAGLAEKSVLTRLLYHCFSCENYLILLVALSTDVDQTDRTAVTLEVATRLQNVVLHPKAIPVDAKLTSVWSTYSLVQNTTQSLLGELNAGRDDRLEVADDGSIRVNGTLVPSPSTSCENLGKILNKAQSSIIRGGHTIDARPGHAMGNPLNPPLAPNQLPLSTIPTPARLPGLPSHMAGPGRLLPIGRLPGLPNLPTALPTTTALPLSLPSSGSPVKRKVPLTTGGAHSPRPVPKGQHDTGSCGQINSIAEDVQPQEQTSSMHNSDRTSAQLATDGNVRDVARSSKEVPSTMEVTESKSSKQQGTNVDSPHSSKSTVLHSQIVTEMKKQPSVPASDPTENTDTVISKPVPKVDKQPKIDCRMQKVDNEPPNTINMNDTQQQQQQHEKQTQELEKQQQPLQQHQEQTRELEQQQQQQQQQQHVEQTQELEQQQQQQQQQHVEQTRELEQQQQPSPLQDELGECLSNDKYNDSRNVVDVSSSMEASYLSPVDPSTSLSAQLAKLHFSSITNTEDTATGPQKQVPLEPMAECLMVKSKKTSTRLPSETSAHSPSQEEHPSLEESRPMPHLRRRGSCMGVSPQLLSSVQTASSTSIDSEQSMSSNLSADDEGPHTSAVQPSASIVGQHPVTQSPVSSHCETPAESYPSPHPDELGMELRPSPHPSELGMEPHPSPCHGKPSAQPHPPPHPPPHPSLVPQPLPSHTAGQGLQPPPSQGELQPQPSTPHSNQPLPQQPPHITGDQMRPPPLAEPTVQRSTLQPVTPLRPIQPVTVARLPPAKTRLAPLQPINKGVGAPKDHNIPLEAYNIELSDSLSSLGTDSDDDLRQSGSHTLGLPHSRRMSLARPTLPPITSESGGNVSSSHVYNRQSSSLDYGGVEPPRYDQVASGSGQQYFSHSASTETPLQTPPESNEQNRHSNSDDVVGEYFRDPHQFASTAEIHTAAMEGVKASTMKRLVFQYGVEYRDAGGRTPLMYAVLGNQPKMCEVLLQMGANVNVKDSAGLTPLLWAAYRARPNAMKVLLRHDADIQCTDPQGRTVYHWSMKTADTQCIKLICKYAKNGIQNKTDNEGLTPLHWAVMCDQDSHIHIFLTSTHVDATCQDPLGRTALNYAILSFSPSAIKAILDHAEEVVNLRDGKGRTALHYACAEDSTDCIRTLLTYKSCNLHCTDYQGTTPLHWAAAANQPEVLKLLLRRGSDRNQEDKRGMTAIGYAQQRGYSDCVKILETYGLKRLPSSVSIASQFQVPSSSTRTVDEYGHVPLLRPHHRMPLSSDSPSDHMLPSLSGPPLDRGTADGNDRISRPSSGFQQNENPVEMEMGIGMQLGIQSASFDATSTQSLPQSIRSNRSSVRNGQEMSSSWIRNGWLRILCGSSGRTVHPPEPLTCGRRRNVIAPMPQTAS